MTAEQMKTFPKLYKKTSTGAIQYWSIEVGDGTGEDPDTGEIHEIAYISTDFGQVGGKIQKTTDQIGKGKNIGKKNETSARQQARLEAQAKWEKQLKKGYVESIEAADAGEVDSVIEGGIVPMLAHKFSEQAHKIKYPCYVQPKLDGIRCIAIHKDGKCTLWSRTRKQINSMPHIVAEIEERFGSLDITLDGELYNHEYKSDFETIVSAVRKDKPELGHEIVQYHIYDVPTDTSFQTRFVDFLGRLPVASKEESCLALVETKFVTDEEEVLTLFEGARQRGYEGVMVRNKDSKYVNKRSYDLQKVKEMEDSEFEIIGIEEGRGKLAGHAIFVCVTEKGEEFKAKMKGDTAMLKTYFENRALWEFRLLTVQYQGFTSYGIPRFPVGLRIREDV